MELLESGSSTPASGSTRYSDDIDSASVTTSSSSEVTGVTGGAVRRDRGLAVSAAEPAVHARPRPAADHTRHDHRTELRAPTRSKFERDNDAFVGDEVIAAPSAWEEAESKQRPQQQQQQQQPAATSKLASDSQTHCVSVELHSTPSGTDAANVWSI